MQGDESTASRPTCAATNKRGEPCGGYAMPGSAFCWTHDPSKAAERKAARSAGGKARHGRKLGKTREATTFADQRGPVQVRSVDDILTLLEKAIIDALQLENSLSRARTLGSLATAALKALEVGEFENRLRVLEEAMNDGAHTR